MTSQGLLLTATDFSNTFIAKNEKEIILFKSDFCEAEDFRALTIQLCAFAFSSGIGWIFHCKWSGENHPNADLTETEFRE